MHSVTFTIMACDLAATPESWLCADCKANTAPGVFSHSQLMDAIQKLDKALWEANLVSIEQTVGSDTELYTVRPAVWEKAGSVNGCLCIGCLERRLGRRLKPKDFKRDDPLNNMPGSARLLNRRGRARDSE